MYTHVFEDEESNGDVFERLRKQGCQVLQQCCPIFWQHHYYESANTRKLKNTIPMFSRTRNPLVTFSKELPDSAAALPHFLETSFLRIFQHYKAKNVYTHVLKDDESYCDIYKRHRNQGCQVMDMVARFSRNIITMNLSPLER